MQHDRGQSRARDGTDVRNPKGTVHGTDLIPAMVWTGLSGYCRQMAQGTEERCKTLFVWPECSDMPCSAIFESQFMPNPSTHPLERAQLLKKSLARWENEGGCPVSAGPGQSGGRDDKDDRGDKVPPLTNAELVQLQIRVIALENLVVSLLADASDQQLARVRDIAASIFPRPGVEHRLTVQATAQMEHLAQRALRI